MNCKKKINEVCLVICFDFNLFSFVLFPRLFICLFWSGWGGIYSKKYVVKIFIEEGKKNFEQLETTLQ